MEEISLRIVLTERFSNSKTWKYFKHHKLKYETIVKENLKESLIVEHHAVI